jgi:hypothetical protein
MKKGIYKGELVRRKDYEMIRMFLWASFVFAVVGFVIIVTGCSRMDVANAISAKHKDHIVITLPDPVVGCLVEYYTGDVNLNGKVNFSDFVLLFNGGPFECNSVADLNNDGCVDYEDVKLLGLGTYYLRTVCITDCGGANICWD